MVTYETLINSVSDGGVFRTWIAIEANTVSLNMSKNIEVKYNMSPKNISKGSQHVVKCVYVRIGCNSLALI